MRSAATVSVVSSTDSVVCESQATFPGSRTSTESLPAGPSTRWMCAGASPVVPTTSSWPSWPISRMSKSAAANRRASACTLVTSGQVASMVRRPLSLASALTSGETPCAENTTTDPSGTASVSSTKIAPRSSRFRTTCVLWTICFRTYTGAPKALEGLLHGLPHRPVDARCSSHGAWRGAHGASELACSPVPR